MTETTRRSKTEQLIVEATFRALHEHGYADLTMQRITAEFDKSKSLLYYYYDNKEDIVRDLLAFAVEQVLADLDRRTGSDPVTNLRAVIDSLLPNAPSSEVLAARHVIVELRAQAVVNEEFRPTFTDIDERLYGRIEGYLAAGQETEDLVVPDVESEAEEFLALLNGALVESATTNRDVIPSVRTALHSRVDAVATTPDE
jgi:AcrR family transcriptional regulator